jgi:hypothetical protein
VRIIYVGPGADWVAPAAPLPFDEEPSPIILRVQWGLRGRFQQQPGGQPGLPSILDEGHVIPQPMRLPKVGVRPVWFSLEDDLPGPAVTPLTDDGALFQPRPMQGLDTVTYLWLGDDTPPFILDEDHPKPAAIVWPRYQVPIVYTQAEDDLPPQPNTLDEDFYLPIPPPVRYHVPRAGFYADDVLGFVVTLPVEEDQYFPRVMRLPDPTAAIQALRTEGWEWLQQAIGALGYRFTVLAQLGYKLDILPGGVTVPGTLYVDTDNLFRIRNLQNLASFFPSFPGQTNYENSATVSAQVTDVTGTPVGGPVLMPYVTGTNGWYEGTFLNADAATMTEYGEYLVTTTIICPDGLEAVIKRRCIARFSA